MNHTIMQWDGEHVVFNGLVIGDMETPIRQLNRAAKMIGDHADSYDKSVLLPNGTLHLYHKFGHIFPVNNEEP